MHRPDNTFDKLAGVPVHYDRYSNPQYGYGTRGKPGTWPCTTHFEEKLHAAFQELWDVCPLGEAEVITTAGAWVNKPGMHGKGRGFDVDGIFWADRTFVTKNYPEDRPFYLAVEAVLRKHFGTVLNYEYNVDHQDHLHIDDGSETGFVPGHRSRVLFLQMAISHVFERPIGIDGVTGPETNGAARKLLVDLALADESDVSSDSKLHERLRKKWMDLLDLTATEGFKRAGVEDVEEETPLDLLADVYDLISRELLGHPGRKKLETAVTAFAQHPETDEWLEQYRDED